MFHEGDFQKLAFRSRVERIGPEKNTKEASKMTAVGNIFAQLPSKPRAPGTAPKNVASAVLSEITVRLGRFGYAFEITGRPAALVRTLLRAASLAPSGAYANIVYI